MAQLQRGDRFPRARPRRRVNKWALGPNAIGQTVTAVGDIGWTNFVSPIGQTEFTLVRTRGEVELVLSAITAGTAGFTGAMAIGIATVDAIGVGVTALPSPASDADFDGWLWHSFFNIHSCTAAIADGSNQLVWKKEIDSKAMRKVSDQYGIFGIMEVSAEVGTVSGFLNADTRILTKLP